jgi:secondary thiamine-phosphate synthase enzyme
VNLERPFRAAGRPCRQLWVRLRENGEVILFQEFETKTGGRLDTVDITDEVVQSLAASGVREGSVLVFSPHTTCCVLLAKPGAATRDALEETMSRLAPDDGYYAHDDLEIRTENLVDDEPANAPAHIFQVLAGKASECIPVVNGSLLLGGEQRVLFVELDSSRERRYCIQVLGNGTGPS